MSRSKSLSITQLREDIQLVLKEWHKVHFKDALFSYLFLYQKALQKQNYAIQDAIRQVIEDGLVLLEAKSYNLAQTLQLRFIEKEPVHAVSSQLNLAESTIYKSQRRAISQLADVIYEAELQARAAHEIALIRRLEPSSREHLIGVEPSFEHISTLLTSGESPWLIGLEGMGGIGKTTLADRLARSMIEQAHFGEVAWVSAKPKRLTLGGTIALTEAPALTTEQFIRQLIAQLLSDIPHVTALSNEDALLILQKRMAQTAYLIIVDNLETMLDVETLLPLLRRLANPTKILLTTRISLYEEADIYHFNLPELIETDALTLVRSEALARNLPHLLNCDDEALRPIFQAVGGNPLALRLVVGQTHIHSLQSVLDNLVKARGEKVENLYTYIYWQAWDSLDELARCVLLAMPLASENGINNLDYLAHISQIPVDEIASVLDQLVSFNLVDSRGDLARYYTIHNLTRTFLEEQIAKWLGGAVA